MVTVLSLLAAFLLLLQPIGSRVVVALLSIVGCLRVVLLQPIGSRTRERDLERMFDRYGRVADVSIKAGGFAFVSFEDERDAADALYKLQGADLDGARIHIEW